MYGDRSSLTARTTSRRSRLPSAHTTLRTTVCSPAAIPALSATAARALSWHRPAASASPPPSCRHNSLHSSSGAVRGVPSAGLVKVSEIIQAFVAVDPDKPEEDMKQLMRKGLLLERANGTRTCVGQYEQLPPDAKEFKVGSTTPTPSPFSCLPRPPFIWAQELAAKERSCCKHQQFSPTAGSCAGRRHPAELLVGSMFLSAAQAAAC